MKGTAIKSGTDIDFFISLSETTTETLKKEIYDKLFGRLTEKKYTPEVSECLHQYQRAWVLRGPGACEAAKPRVKRSQPLRSGRPAPGRRRM